MLIKIVRIIINVIFGKIYINIKSDIVKKPQVAPILFVILKLTIFSDSQLYTYG